MSGKRQSDLKGMEFGTWKVIEYTEKSKYNCQCIKCGAQKEINGYFLKKGQIPQCYSCNSDKTNKGRIDLTNKRFGQWTVLEYLGNKKWKCRCDCGVIRDVAGNDLRNGKSTGCGHATNRYQEDLTGKQFNEWNVLSYSKEKQRWECRCSCGKIGYLHAYQLKNGSSKSCGHDTTGFKDLTGQKFGEWTVLRRDTYYEADALRNDTYWLCKCSCGNVRTISGYVLRHGASTSCGCRTEAKRVETTLQKYGVPHASQIGTSRTAEQLNMVSSNENLIKAIQMNFNKKPTTYELSLLLGIDRASTMRYIHKFSIESIVEIGNASVSRYEKEIKEMFPTEYTSDRKVLDGMELDLYYPDKRFAIEFNGNYWHCDYIVDKMYHQEKSRRAEEKGIQVIHIFEYEWNNENTRKKLISVIDNKIFSDRKTKIYARDCIVKQVNFHEISNFLDTNHLQGAVASNINFALYSSEGKLVGVMTFGIPRFNEGYQYEMIRFALRNNMNIIGGAEKLFSHFVYTYKPKSIISYCDISKFSGYTYKKLGFKLKGISEPNYKWVDNHKNVALSRYQTQKQRLIDSGLGKYGSTEVEIMRNLGFLRVYDCGNKVFVWQAENM